MAILEKGCTLQRKYHQIEHAVPEELNLVTRFRRLIDANFIENRTVEDINKVMTDYMNDVKKEADIYTHFTHNRSLFSQDFNKVFELLVKGIVRPQINEVIELKNAPEAHTKLEAGKVTGKLVLSIE